MPFESFHVYASTVMFLLSSMCLCTQKGLGDFELWQPPSEESGEGRIEKGRRDGEQKCN